MSGPTEQEAALLKAYAISEARATEQHEARLGELRAVMRGLIITLAVSIFHSLVALGLILWKRGGL